MNGIRKGILRDFRGSWGSGLGYLVIEDSETHVVESIPCDNAPMVRALEACFGNVIGKAHTVAKKPGFVGREVYWSYDEFGLTLGGFTPTADADPRLEAAYEGAEV
jgi:hypothetical protein